MRSGYTRHPQDQHSPPRVTSRGRWEYFPYQPHARLAHSSPRSLLSLCMSSYVCMSKKKNSVSFGRSGRSPPFFPTCTCRSAVSWWSFTLSGFSLRALIRVRLREFYDLRRKKDAHRPVGCTLNLDTDNKRKEASCIEKRRCGPRKEKNLDLLMLALLCLFRLCGILCYAVLSTCKNKRQEHRRGGDPRGR